VKERKEKIWSQPLRVENPQYTQLTTSRCCRSALWFVNNKELEERIHAFLAKYVEKYGVKLYAFRLVGNHYHLLADFPLSNSAHFHRDFNARVAESVRLLVSNYESGSLFERRYSSQALPTDEDRLDYFFYVVLQPVSSGQCTKISEYPGRCSFADAVGKKEREYKYFAYGEYQTALANKPNTKRKNFWRSYKLKFERLPGFEALSSEGYEEFMHTELERRRVQAIRELLKEKPRLKFRTKAQLRQVRPGSRPRTTKTGTKRPLVLTKSQEARKSFLGYYFNTVGKYREVCEKYKEGDFEVIFPPGTYRPPGLAIYSLTCSL